MYKLVFTVMVVAAAMCCSQVMAQCPDCVNSGMQSYGSPVYSSPMYSTAGYSTPAYSSPMYNVSYGYSSPVMNSGCGCAPVYNSPSNYGCGCCNCAMRGRQNCCRPVSYCAPAAPACGHSCCGGGVVYGGGMYGGNICGGQIISGCGDCAAGMMINGGIVTEGIMMEGEAIQNGGNITVEGVEVTPVPDSTTVPPAEGNVGAPATETPPPTPDDT